MRHVDWGATFPNKRIFCIVLVYRVHLYRQTTSNVPTLFKGTSQLRVKWLYWEAALSWRPVKSISLLASLVLISFHSPYRMSRLLVTEALSELLVTNKLVTPQFTRRQPPVALEVKERARQIHNTSFGHWLTRQSGATMWSSCFVWKLIFWACKSAKSWLCPESESWLYHTWEN